MSVRASSARRISQGRGFALLEVSWALSGCNLWEGRTIESSPRMFGSWQDTVGESCFSTFEPRSFRILGTTIGSDFRKTFAGRVSSDIFIEGSGERISRERSQCKMDPNRRTSQLDKAQLGECIRLSADNWTGRPICLPPGSLSASTCRPAIHGLALDQWRLSVRSLMRRLVPCSRLLSSPKPGRHRLIIPHLASHFPDLFHRLMEGGILRRVCLRDAAGQAGAGVSAQTDLPLGFYLSILMRGADHRAAALAIAPALPEAAKMVLDQIQCRGQSPLEFVVRGAALFVFAVIGLWHWSCSISWRTESSLGDLDFS